MITLINVSSTMIGAGKETYREPGEERIEGHDSLAGRAGRLPRGGCDVWRMSGVVPARRRRREGSGGENCVCKEHHGRGRWEERRGGGKSAGRDRMGKLLGECRGATDFKKCFIGKNSKHAQ